VYAKKNGVQKQEQKLVHLCTGAGHERECSEQAGCFLNSQFRSAIHPPPSACNKMASSQASYSSDKERSDIIKAENFTAYPTPKIVSAQDADPLVAYLHEHRDVRESTDEENAQVVRQIRWHVIPLVVVITLLLYIDKVCLGLGLELLYGGEGSADYGP